MLCIVLCVGKLSLGQQRTSDSVSTKTKGYPILKLFELSYDVLGPNDYTAEIDGYQVHKGTVKGGSLLAYGSVFLMNKPKHILSITELYRRDFISLNDTENPIYAGQKKTYSFNRFNTSFNYTNRNSWNGRPLISTASLYVATSDIGRIDKFSGILTSTLVFQNKPQTRYTLGLVVLADLSTSTPLFPIVSYWHRFKDPSWELNVVLPKEAFIRKGNVLGGWVSAGTELISKNYFLYELPEREGTYENRFTELQTGLKYEYIFKNGLMLSAGAGYRNVLQNNIVEVYHANKTKIGNMNYEGSWFAKVGVSFVIQEIKK